MKHLPVVVRIALIGLAAWLAVPAVGTAAPAADREHAGSTTPELKALRKSLRAQIADSHRGLAALHKRLAATRDEEERRLLREMIGEHGRQVARLHAAADSVDRELESREREERVRRRPPAGKQP